MVTLCLGSLPWTLGTIDEGNSAVPRYNAGDPANARMAPFWTTKRPEATDGNIDPQPTFLLGSDLLGRSVLIRALAGGGISLGIGFAAAAVSVSIGTLYGAIAGYAGGMLDAVMMRVVDVLYGLPYILLVVLLAVASNAMVDEYITRAKSRAAWVIEQGPAHLEGAPADSPEAFRAWLTEHPDKADAIEAKALAAVPPRRVSSGTRSLLDVGTLLIAIGGVSWLTLARVIRGQVLSLKGQPFVEAARAESSAGICYQISWARS